MTLKSLNPFSRFMGILGLLASIGLAFGFPAWAAETDQESPVGAVGGAVHADPFTGTATTSIPIDVPPGRGGVQPNLALVYGSSNGNGWVGQGWKLEKGVIDRQTKFGVDYSGDDYVFRLSGINVELVNVGTNEYRAKVEGGFTRIKKLTSSDGRPYFEATDKSGMKFIFGTVAATRVADPANADNIFRWCLERVEDVHGNYMTISYTSDQGQAYLSQIDYTGNGSLAPTHQVKFYLETRSDAVAMYTTGFKMTTAKRLKTIELKANGTRTAAYKISYESGSPSLLKLRQLIMPSLKVKSSPILFICAIYPGFTLLARTRRDYNTFALFFGAFILAIGSLLTAAPAQADCPGTILNGETVTDRQLLALGESCTVEKGGKISTSLNGAAGDGISGAGSNTIINKGEITVKGKEAWGIAIHSDNTVINEGIITLSDEDGVGIGAESVSTGNTIINRGIVTTTGKDARGVVFDSDSKLFNTGLITTAGAGAWAVGFTSGNTIINYGSIVTTNDDEESSAIFTSGGDDNTIINGGLISATGRFSHAIWLKGDANNNEIVLLPGSVIIGSIRIDRDTNILTVKNGLSVFKTFSESGVLPLLNPMGAPMVIRGLQVAVVDPTLFSISDEIITDIANGIRSAVDRRLGRLNSNTMTSSTGPFWVHAFGSYRDQQGDSPSVDTDHWGAGLVTGMDWRIGSGTVAGVFLGGSASMVDHQYNAQQEDAAGYFGGAYGSFTSNKITIGAKVTGGMTDHDRERVVANNMDMDDGLQTATADYYGYFVAPELSVSISLPATDKITVEPSASLRYIGFFLDGFAESGASDEFVVSDRNIHLLQGRLQVAATVPLTRNGESYSLVPRFGLDFRSIIDGDRVNAILLGQDINFDPGGEDNVVGGFVGLDFNGSINDTVSIYAAIEGLYSSDNSLVVSGGAGINLKF